MTTTPSPTPALTFVHLRATQATTAAAAREALAELARDPDLLRHVGGRQRMTHEFFAVTPALTPGLLWDRLLSCSERPAVRTLLSNPYFTAELAERVVDDLAARLYRSLSIDKQRIVGLNLEVLAEAGLARRSSRGVPKAISYLVGHAERRGVPNGEVLDAVLRVEDLTSDDLVRLSAVLTGHHELERIVRHPSATPVVWRAVAKQARGYNTEVMLALADMDGARTDPSIRPLLTRASCSLDVRIRSLMLLDVADDEFEREVGDLVEIAAPYVLDVLERRPPPVPMPESALKRLLDSADAPLRRRAITLLGRLRIVRPARATARPGPAR